MNWNRSKAMRKSRSAVAWFAVAAALALPTVARAETPARPANVTTPAYRQSFQQGQTLSKEARSLVPRDAMRAGAQHVYASYAYEKAASAARNPPQVRDAHRAAGNAQLNAAYAYRRAGDHYAAATSLRAAQKHFAAAGLGRTAAATGAAANRQMTRATSSGQTAYPRAR
jgi:hypothetical protein